ncbi:predicted protein [Arabidopsis lyrata subsp. lyrata]|uniref:Predicted protein n=1 Tax=Arabidopsis lyrata subsp. lyrata TaxID=81972 RepID=D7MFM4_ARALL|nr:predicted protein [Arabidopsis lyrata subsp. lyrata]
MGQAYTLIIHFGKENGSLAQQAVASGRLGCFSGGISAVRFRSKKLSGNRERRSFNFLYLVGI